MKKIILFLLFIVTQNNLFSQSFYSEIQVNGLTCAMCSYSTQRSLEKSKEKFIGKKVKIFAISNEKIDRIKEFIDKRKFDLKFLKSNNDLSFFNAYSLPTTIIFNKNGDEEFRINSGIDFTSKKFVERIMNLEKL